MSRRKFSKEFKVAVGKLILDNELPVYQIAKELSVFTPIVFIIG